MEENKNSRANFQQEESQSSFDSNLTDPNNNSPSTKKSATTTKIKNPSRRRHNRRRSQKQNSQNHNSQAITHGITFGNLKAIPTDPRVDPPLGCCFNCWSPDHRRSQCRQPLNPNFCTNCGRHGVNVQACPRCADAKVEYLRCFRQKRRPRRVRSPVKLEGIPEESEGDQKTIVIREKIDTSENQTTIQEESPNEEIIFEPPAISEIAQWFCRLYIPTHVDTQQHLEIPELKKHDSEDSFKFSIIGLKKRDDCLIRGNDEFLARVYERWR